MSSTSIWDYHWHEQPWFDAARYTPFQIALFTTGALLWMVAYSCAIYNGWTHKRERALSIPVVAVVLNWGCEVTTGFFALPDMGRVLVLAYWAWMILDLCIVVIMFRYGRGQFARTYSKQQFVTMLVLGIVVSFVVQCTFIRRYDLPMAPLDSYIINLIMSICFIRLVYVPGFTGNSKLVAWTKCLGTGIISVAFYSKYPENQWLTILYIGCAAFDVAYIYLLHRRQLGHLSNPAPCLEA